jgi:arsenate reductase (thioredoxin)
MLLSLIAALALPAMFQVSSAQSEAPQKVVFICEHGAAKSVVAAAHFNRLAEERGLPFRAISRGTVPDPRVPALVSDGLRADAAPIERSFVPTRVASSDAAGAARIVTFDVKLPDDVHSGAVTNWTGVPNFSDGYGAARADIVARVDALLRELASANRRQ